MKEYIEKVIAPKLQGDGGWIEVISYNERHLTVGLRGECSKCMVASRCMDWVKEEVKRDLEEDVEITMIRRKPYFWDL